MSFMSSFMSSLSYLSPSLRFLPFRGDFSNIIENSLLLLMFRLLFESFHSSGQAYDICLRAVDWSASTISFHGRKYDIVLIAEPRWGCKKRKIYIHIKSTVQCRNVGHSEFNGSVLGETSRWGHERTMAPNVTTHRWSCRERGEGVGIRDVSKFTRCREKERGVPWHHCDVMLGEFCCSHRINWTLLTFTFFIIRIVFPCWSRHEFTLTLSYRNSSSHHEAPASKSMCISKDIKTLAGRWP